MTAAGTVKPEVKEAVIYNRGVVSTGGRGDGCPAPGQDPRRC